MKTRTISRALLTYFLLFFGAVLGQVEITQSDAEKLVKRMQQAYDKVDDYICVFNKQERIDGELLPMETIQLKFKKPFSVYMHWIEDPREGMEVVFVKGENNGKMIAHPGSFPDITVRVQPDGNLAMRQNRHPITEVGIGNAINIISEDITRAKENPKDSVQYLDHGKTEIAGEESHCIEAIMPAKADSDYYAHRALICYNTSTNLLNQIKIWNHENVLVENYRYTDVQINPGLSDEAFQPDNPEYDF